MRGDESTEDCGEEEEEEEGGGHTGLEKGKENESRSVSGNLCSILNCTHTDTHKETHSTLKGMI